MESEQNKAVMSFTTTPEMMERLRRCRDKEGIRISWLINALLKNHFMKLRDEQDGE